MESPGIPGRFNALVGGHSREFGRGFGDPCINDSDPTDTARFRRCVSALVTEQQRLDGHLP
jgi:hypothetical protein